MAETKIVSIDDLHNESDVEQKLVYPILTAPQPYGLGLNSPNIRTKTSIKAFEIGKRKNKKVYYPDYVIVISGFPLVVIEVKPPSDQLEEAYSEARLYAAEVNSLFAHSINPVSKIICTNGKQFIAGFSDTDNPQYNLSLEELDPANTQFFGFISDFNLDRLQETADKLHKTLYKDKYYQPVKMLGGQAIRNEEVGTNTFGNTIALDYQHLFNPNTYEERAYIVTEAYITSKSRERYILPIDKIVRAAIPPSESDSKVIFSDNPRNILETIKKARNVNLEHKILLLIGNVGSGKSTFVDYLVYKALPKELLESTIWIRVDMNEAPLDKGIIYDWICEQIIAEFRRSNNSIDFDELETLLKIYATDINKFQKGRGRLLEEKEYNLELFKELEKLQIDKKATVRAYIRYLCAEKSKLGILVFDNCDKRIRDEQLLMFQAAQWLQHEFRLLIFLPLRDVTYDSHRHEPPLDTALKDLVFRIEPPGFQEVLVARLKLALSDMQKNSTEKTLSYQLPNNMRVSFPAEKLAYFLTSILRSLFEHDKYLRWMIVGLAGRDLRKAMEIFLDFCKSGHITEDEILKICQSEGNYAIPFDVVSRVLTKMNRRFYDSDSSYVKNIFHCDPNDPRPFHFTRLAILRWLHRNHKNKGQAQQIGYHQVSNLKSDLFLIGLSDDTVSRELLYLLKASCIVAEHLRVDHLDDEDLIALSPAGFVHLDLINTTEYLAAVSEDTYYSDRSLAKSISERIADRNKQHKSQTSLKNAISFSEYLENKVKNDVLASDSFLKETDWMDLISIEDTLQSVESKIKKESLTNPWFDLETRLKEGDIVTCTVKTLTDFGIFATIEKNLDGLIRNNNLGSYLFKEHERVEARILRIDNYRQKIELTFSIEEDESRDILTIDPFKDKTIQMPKKKK
jgi:DNA-directed RNA polymerase subunit E'/Rpb7